MNNRATQEEHGALEKRQIAQQADLAEHEHELINAALHASSPFPHGARNSKFSSNCAASPCARCSARAGSCTARSPGPWPPPSTRIPSYMPWHVSCPQKLRIARDCAARQMCLR